MPPPLSAEWDEKTMRPPLQECKESRIFTHVCANINNVVCASSANCVCVCVFIEISDMAKYSALNNPIVSHTFCIASGGFSSCFVLQLHAALAGCAELERGLAVGVGDYKVGASDDVHTDKHGIFVKVGTIDYHVV